VTYTAACGEVPQGPPPYNGPDTVTSGNASGPNFISQGSGNLAGFQIYGTITNGGPGLMHSITMQIPYTLSAGGPLNCDMSRSYGNAVGSCSVTGTTLTVTLNFSSTVSANWTVGHSQSVVWVYVGTSTGPGNITLGTPVVTAAS
jgi:hypothetical protein